MSEQPRLPLLAVIREAECIGCAKCIQACPVDAILGSAKQMHTVIADECIGCKLCLPPCPVDCIDLIPVKTISPFSGKQKAALIKKRYTRRQTRLREREEDAGLHLEFQERSDYIQDALRRIQSKK